MAPIPSGPSWRWIVSPIDITAAWAAPVPARNEGATEDVRTIRRIPSLRRVNGRDAWTVATLPVTRRCIDSRAVFLGSTEPEPAGKD
jgi:hypothetical protein